MSGGCIHTPKRERVTVRTEGTEVLLIHNGRLVFRCPWQKADELAKMLTAKARQAEEQARAPEIAWDSAILLRSGAPLGFSSDPKIQGEALKSALYSRDLRRYLPGGIRSKAIFGQPTMVAHPPKRKENTP